MGRPTPGPWEFGKERRWLFRDNLKTDGVFSSSTILKIDDDAFRPNEADARLIASAPELLEALEALLNQDCPNRQYANGHPAAENARAAIARARGEQA